MPNRLTSITFGEGDHATATCIVLEDGYFFPDTQWELWRMLLRAVTLGLVRAALVYLLSRPGKSETRKLGVKRKWVHEDREDMFLHITEDLCSEVFLYRAL